MSFHTEVYLSGSLTNDGNNYRNYRNSLKDTGLTLTKRTNLYTLQCISLQGRLVGLLKDEKGTKVEQKIHY